MLSAGYRAQPPRRESFWRAYAVPVAMKVIALLLSLVGIHALLSELSPQFGQAVPLDWRFVLAALLLAAVVILFDAFRRLHARLSGLELQNYHLGLAVEAGEALVTPGLRLHQHRLHQTDGNAHRSYFG